MSEYCPYNYQGHAVKLKYPETWTMPSEKSEIEMAGNAEIYEEAQYRFPDRDPTVSAR